MKRILLLVTLLHFTQITCLNSDDSLQGLSDDGTITCGLGLCCLIAPCTGAPVIIHQPLMVAAHCCMTRGRQQCYRSSPILCPNKVEGFALAVSTGLPCCVRVTPPCSRFPNTDPQLVIPGGLCQAGTAFCVIPFITSFFMEENK